MRKLIELIDCPSLLVRRALVADAVVSGATGILLVLGAALVDGRRSQIKESRFLARKSGM